jgi:putative oxidoreductase
MGPRPSPLGPIMLSVLRIVAGLLFLEHGMQKFLSFPPGQAAGMGLALNSMPAYAGIVELLCGFLIAIGLFTRAAAFLASGTMAVAYWSVHARMGFFPVNNMGDAAILYCFVFLYISAVGAGPWSADAALAARHPPRP